MKGKFCIYRAICALVQWFKVLLEVGASSYLFIAISIHLVILRIMYRALPPSDSCCLLWPCKDFDIQLLDVSAFNRWMYIQPLDHFQ